MDNLKIKIVTGFRQDQCHSISIDEAPKAYYIFMNPEKRAVFSGGLALVGQDVRKIEPDYHGTMGWNHSHMLDGDDWNEIRRSGVERKLRDAMQVAQQIAYTNRMDLIQLPLPQAQMKLLGSN
jgi:hypothetical protein